MKFTPTLLAGLAHATQLTDSMTSQILALLAQEDSTADVDSSSVRA